MKPNFFIIGAPKSGTTALSEYLRLHPQVCFSVDKEPNFWNDDFTGICSVRSLDEYLDLFRHGGPAHRACGEASVNYLNSLRAVPRILTFNPEARFIALLRNPVELAHSWHSQMLFGLYEDEADFEKAWALQDERAAGRSIPATCPDGKVLLYRDVAALGSQTARLLDAVPRDRVRLYLFDDFKADPGAVYRDALAFLGLDDDGRMDFPVVNENKTHKNPALARFVERPPRLWTAGARVVRRTLGIQRIGLMRRLRDANKQPAQRAELRPEFRAALTAHFRSEIEQLGTVLDRDLSHWLADVPAASGRMTG